MKRLIPWIGVTSAAIILVAVALFLFFRSEGKTNTLPADLGEMKLTQQLSGEPAQGMIDHLHGKGVTPRENFIGFYEGSGAQATLYVSVYADEAEAKEVYRKMAQRIQAGNPVFGSYKEVSVAGQPVSECMGMGQVHYFFFRGNRVYWLETDPSAAQRAAESLLNTIGR